MPPEPEPIADHAIERAVEAQRMAEQMQRDPQAAVARYVDSLPGLSDRKRAYLKSRPLLLQPETTQILRAEYAAALAEGVEDDSDAMERRLDLGIVAQLRAREQRQVEGARAAAPMPPPMPEPSIERAAQQLDHDADAARSFINVEASMPHAVSANLPMPETMPRRSSIPFSAPVSRNIPSPSGKPTPDFRSIVLSPAEREIARNSFTDAPGMTDEAKERRYALNKSRMLKMRAEGTLNE
jgi:hypothetical protein